MSPWFKMPPFLEVEVTERSKGCLDDLSKSRLYCVTLGENVGHRNAYVSDFEDLELQYDLRGTNFGLLKTTGVFANPQGLIFVDVGDADCLVIETRGERYPRIAVQLPRDQDANAVAHEIMRAVPDSGPVD